MTIAAALTSLALAQSPTPPAAQAQWHPMIEQPCPSGCRWRGQGSSSPVGNGTSAAQPKALAPWLRAARAVNRYELSPENCGPSLDSIAAALKEHSGTPVEISPALREASRGDGQPLWWEGYSSPSRQVRTVDLLGGLWHTRFHPCWKIDAGVITLITHDEFDAAARSADQDPRNEELAALRARVRVHWDEPVLHTEEGPLDDHAPWRVLLLGAKLTFLADTGVEQPITWPLSVRVLIARRPDEAPDWSSGSSEKDTYAIWVACVDGELTEHLELQEIERVPGEVRAFQVALCLPDLEPGGTWRRTARSLPQSVRTLALAGPVVLDEDLQRINACVANDALQYDPIAYVRAVNRLRRLGKARALERLREFARLAPSDGFATQAPLAANLDRGNSACVFGIVRLLFDFDQAAREAVADQRRPGRPQAVNGFCMSTGMVAALPYESASYPGDQYPFVVVDGLPFFAPEWLEGRTGYDPSPFDAIDWAEKYGTIRGSDLVPSDDPIATVETLEARVGPVPKKNDLNLQVARALSEVSGRAVEIRYEEYPDDYGNSGRRFIPDRRRSTFELTELKSTLRSRGGVHWDAEAERYALGPRKQ